jgi:hypothetical protein
MPAFGGSTGGSTGGMTVPLVMAAADWQRTFNASRAMRFPQIFVLEEILAASAAQSRHRRRDSFQSINSLAKAV